MTKELLLKTAKKLPDQFHMDELFERLRLMEDLEKAEMNLDEGKGISHEEAIRQIQEHLNDLKKHV